jgi:hypothetical protein
VAFGFVDELEKDIVDRPTDEGAEIEEFAVNSMKSRLQEIALARVLRIKELQEVQYEGLIDVSFGQVRVEIWAFDESEEKLIDNLKVRPCQFKDGLVFFRIKGVADRVYGRGY